MKIRIFFSLLSLSMVTIAQSQISKPLDVNFHKFLNEVFTNEAKIQSSSRSYYYFKELYTNRIKYVKLDENSKFKGDYQQILDFPLNNEYNKNLIKDVSFRMDEFNPFKYEINFYSKRTQVFVLGNSGYIMVITPQEIPSLNRF